MAIQSSFYTPDGSTRTFPSTKHIASKQHMAVWFRRLTDSVWVVQDVASYELINNTAVLVEAPDVALYDNIEIRVADTYDELTDSPSAIAIVAGLATEIVKLTTEPVATYLATSGENATAAKLETWNAMAERLTADSYATEASGVFVKIYTSNDDGTFTATPTTEYSALHYSTIASGDKVINVADYTDLQALDTSIVTKVNLTELHPGITESGGTFIWNQTADKATANPGTRIDPSVSLALQGTGVGLGCWERTSTEYVTPEMFGAKGDNVDDTAALASMFTYAVGVEVIGTYGAIYVSTTTQVCSSILNLNGSRIKFNIIGAIKCLDMRDNSRVFNGSVENNGTVPSGSGAYQCPILVGNYANGTGYQNISLSNLDIITNRPNGNGIMVTGDSNNITINNINFPSSTELGRGILVHWGNADAPSTGTKHPYNIKINNITSDSLTNTSVDSALVFVSSAFNIETSNIKATNCGMRAVYSQFFGDYGNYYAPANVKNSILHGVNISNAHGEMIDASSSIIKVDCKSTSAPVNTIGRGPRISNCSGTGIGSTSTSSCFSIAKCYGAIIEDGKGEQFYQGVSTGEEVVGLKVKRGEYYNNQLHGVSFTNSTIPPENCMADGVISYANGQGGGNSAGVYIGDSINCKAINTVTGIVGETTQDWGIRVDNASINSIVTDNFCEDATVSAFSIGAATTYNVCKEYHGNTSNATTVHSGMSPQIITTMQRGTNTSRECLGGAAPISGTWKQGDRVYSEVPGAGGFMGWVCTIAGTPGTWKTFGAISV